MELLGQKFASEEGARRLEAALARLRRRQPANVLVTGATGIGKSWLARRLAADVLGAGQLEEVHLRGGDPKMVVSQIFGTRRGDFTGAENQEGAVQRALKSGGVLLIEEMQALDDFAQQALLPLLDLPERRFGGLSSSTHRLDGPLWILATTNQEIMDCGWKRCFRADFWYRFAGLHLHLPSLAERGPKVVAAYLDDMTVQVIGRPACNVFDGEALACLHRSPWPGNLRELRSFVEESAALRMQGDASPYLTQGDLPAMVVGDEHVGRPSGEVPPSTGLRDLEQRHGQESVLAALDRNGWVQAHAARELGMHAQNLHRLLKARGLLDEVAVRKASARNHPGDMASSDDGASSG